MKNNLGTQPINGEKVKMRLVIATLLDIIGGSSNSVQNKDLDNEVKKIQECETKGTIEGLEKRILQSYKEGKVKTQKGPKIKKAEVKSQDIEKSKGQTKAKAQKDKSIDDDLII